MLIAIVPSEDPACLAYCVEEDEDVPECVSIGSEDMDVEIQKPEVKAILKELADIKRKEADCYERLAAAIPWMSDEEVTEVGERVQLSRLPKCVDQLYDRLKNPTQQQLNMRKQRNHLKRRVVARSPPKSTVRIRTKQNLVLFRTTNSSQRRYELKS